MTKEQEDLRKALWNGDEEVKLVEMENESSSMPKTKDIALMLLRKWWD